MEDNYPKAYKEVIEILNFVPKESVDKIPKSLIDTFKSKMNKNYVFLVDVNKKFEDLELLNETKAILANIFKDCWATPYQREKIKSNEELERQKNNEAKRLKYNLDDIFNNNQVEKINQIQNHNENIPTEMKKERFYKKILDFFKKLFHI